MNAGYVMLRGLRVENATAMIYGLTYGFPALTGIMGAVHAASRALSKTDDVAFEKALIACRRCTPLMYEPYRGAVRSFLQQARTPLKNGAAAPIIEEGKCHVELTLMLEVKANRELAQAEGEELAENVLFSMMERRLAGGVIVGFAKRMPSLFFDPDSLWDARRWLFPSYILMERHDVLTRYVKDLNLVEDATGLDALIAMNVLNHEKQEGGDDWQVYPMLKKEGWLVPLSVGFRRISPLYAPGEVENCRMDRWPAAFVEGLYSVGQWVFPHRIENLSDAFWRYAVKDGDYLITQELKEN